MNSKSNSMEKIIEESKKLEKEALNEPKQKIRCELSTYFRDINWQKLNQNDGLFKIEKYDDLKGLKSGPGFYVILTNYKETEKNCTLAINKNTAIYRGHCSNLRRRVESHLFNKKYNEEYFKRRADKEKKGEKFSEVPFNACMKIDPEVSGININDETYSKYEWYVIQFKMPLSSQFIREQAEGVFDELFGKPFANRK